MSTLFGKTTLLALCCAVVALGAAMCAQVTDEGARKSAIVYYWSPQSNDVPSDTQSEEVVRLRFLLEHAVGVQYTVSPLDANGLDDVITVQLLVSAERFPNAYRIYYNEVQRRNPALHGADVQIGDKIILPSGPKFAALELKGASEVSYDRKAAANLQLRNLPDLNEQLISSLKDYTRGWTSSRAAGQTTVSDVQKPAVAAEIRNRKLVPPPVSGRGQIVTDTESVHMIADAATMPNSVRAGSTDEFLPASDDGVAACSGCKSCTDILGHQSHVSGKVKLLVADTGVFNGSSATIAFKPDGQDSADVDPLFHGSFVYSETVSTFFGPLDPGVVEVAKVAERDQSDPSGKTYHWNVAYLKDAVARLATRYPIENPVDPDLGTQGPVWVVNISAGGRSKVSDVLPNIFASDLRLLFVASAGNHSNSTDPVRELFPVVNSPAANLLIVGSLDQDDKRPADYSNYHHEKVDIFVRGTCICGRPPQRNGTSQAAPIVSVAATILADKYPNWDAQHLKWRLISSSDLTPETDNCAVDERCAAGGVLNLNRALSNTTIVRYKVHGSDGSTTSTEEPVDSISASGGWGDITGQNARSSAPILRVHIQKCREGLGGDVLCYRQYRLTSTPTEAVSGHVTDLTVISNHQKRSILRENVEDIFLPMN